MFVSLSAIDLGHHHRGLDPAKRAQPQAPRRGLSPVRRRLGACVRDHPGAREPQPRARRARTGAGGLRGGPARRVARHGRRVWVRAPVVPPDEGPAAPYVDGQEMGCAGEEEGRALGLGSVAESEQSIRIVMTTSANFLIV